MVARWNLGLPRLVSSLELAPIHYRFAAREQFNRATRLLVPVEHQSGRDALAEMHAAFAASGGRSGRPPDRAAA